MVLMNLKGIWLGLYKIELDLKISHGSEWVLIIPKKQKKTRNGLIIYKEGLMSLEETEWVLKIYKRAWMSFKTPQINLSMF